MIIFTNGIVEQLFVTKSLNEKEQNSLRCECPGMLKLVVMSDHGEQGKVKDSSRTFS